MKKYLVIRSYRGTWSPDIVGQFDSKEDAETFAKLYNQSDKDRTYLVYEQSK